MELCDSDLAKELKKCPDGMLSSSVIELARQMARVTRYLARKKIIHRDIKPQNILIVWKGNPGFGLSFDPLYKLADFGSVSAMFC